MYLFGRLHIRQKQGESSRCKLYIGHGQWHCRRGWILGRIGYREANKKALLCLLRLIIKSLNKNDLGLSYSASSLMKVSLLHHPNQVLLVAASVNLEWKRQAIIPRTTNSVDIDLITFALFLVLSWKVPCNNLRYWSVIISWSMYSHSY